MRYSRPGRRATRKAPASPLCGGAAASRSLDWTQACRRRPSSPRAGSGGAQRAAFARILDQTKAEGLARVVFLHHPPHVGGARRLRGLEDAANFEAVIARHGAELVLHGHNHRRSVYHLAGPKGRVPVVGAASASAKPGGHRPAASYNLFEISAEDDGFSVKARARGVDDSGERIVDLGALEL